VVTNVQLYIAIGVPLLFNAGLIGLVIGLMNAKFGAVESRFASVESRFASMETRFDAIDKRFDAIDKRFDDMRDLWRAELRRVEEVLDARLKHLEAR
jgi:hypothetical protein